MNPLESDGVFQLNVLLWALIPNDGGTVPALHDRGFSLEAVEMPLLAGAGEQAALAGLKTAAVVSPTVDLLIRSSSGRRSLIECKAHSYSLTSDSARQARGLIAAAGAAATRLADPQATGEMAVVVPSADAPRMMETLVKARLEVASYGVPTGPVGTIGLELGKSAVALELAGTDGHLLCPMAPEHLEVVLLGPDDDPRPLYIVPWHPSAQDLADREEFREKLRQALLVLVGRSQIGGTTRIEFLELASMVTRGVFDKWRDRRSLRGQVFKEVGRICQALVGTSSLVRVLSSRLDVTLATADERARLLDLLRRQDIAVQLKSGYQPEFEFPPE